MVLEGTAFEIVMVVITGFFGIIALAASVQSWLLTRCALWERIVLAHRRHHPDQAGLDDRSHRRGHHGSDRRHSIGKAEKDCDGSPIRMFEL